MKKVRKIYKTPQAEPLAATIERPCLIGSGQKGNGVDMNVEDVLDNNFWA